MCPGDEIQRLLVGEGGGVGEQLENSQHHLLFKSDNCFKFCDTNRGTNAQVVSLLRIPTLCLSFCKFSINGLSSMDFHSVQKENLLKTYKWVLVSTVCGPYGPPFIVCLFSPEAKQKCLLADNYRWKLREVFGTSISDLGLPSSKRMIAGISHFNCCLSLGSGQLQELLCCWVRSTSQGRRR